MTDYELISGKILTDDDIERECAEYESGTWEGHLIDLRVGRPRLSQEQNMNLSFKCPKSSAELIARAAKMSGIKKSAFMRNAAIEQAKRILSKSS